MTEIKRCESNGFFFCQMEATVYVQQAIRIKHVRNLYMVRIFKTRETSFYSKTWILYFMVIFQCRRNGCNKKYFCTIIHVHKVYMYFAGSIHHFEVFILYALWENVLFDLINIYLYYIAKKYVHYHS